jgi:hypothetical protein
MVVADTGSQDGSDGGECDGPSAVPERLIIAVVALRKTKGVTAI